MNAVRCCLRRLQLRRQILVLCLCSVCVIFTIVFLNGTKVIDPPVTIADPELSSPTVVLPVRTHTRPPKLLPHTRFEKKGPLANPLNVKSGLIAHTTRNNTLTTHMPITVAPHVAKHPLDKISILRGNTTLKFGYNLTVSREKLNRIITDQLAFRELASTANKTRDYVLKSQPNYDKNSAACECGRISKGCHCCAKLTLSNLDLTGVVCANFVYQLNNQALQVELTYDSKPMIAQRLLGVKSLPTLCVGLTNIDICIQFRHVEYLIQIHSAHKTELKGCVDIFVRLAYRNVGYYPMGCFRSYRDNSFVHAVDKMGNWVP